jgi:hypothetical protein
MKSVGSGLFSISLSLTAVVDARVGMALFVFADGRTSRPDCAYFGTEPYFVNAFPANG